MKGIAFKTWLNAGVTSEMKSMLSGMEAAVACLPATGLRYKHWHRQLCATRRLYSLWITTDPNMHSYMLNHYRRAMSVILDLKGCYAHFQKTNTFLSITFLKYRSHLLVLSVTILNCVIPMTKYHS